jgi:hypothetical protein
MEFNIKAPKPKSQPKVYQVAQVFAYNHYEKSCPQRLDSHAIDCHGNYYVTRVQLYYGNTMN